MKTLILIAMVLNSGLAMAEFEKHQSQNIDFNKMIESNNQEMRHMKKEISQNGFGARPADIRSDQKRVVDFLDVEVGMGEAPKISDRRFN